MEFSVSDNRLSGGVPRSFVWPALKTDIRRSGCEGLGLCAYMSICQLFTAGEATLGIDYQEHDVYIA